MKVQIIDPEMSEVDVAHLNRECLERSGVSAVNIVGGPGCGKTSLILATLEQLLPSTRVGVITADPDSHRDADELAQLAGGVVQVNTGQGRLLNAALVQSAIRQLELDRLDLLLIENVSTLVGPPAHDLGEGKRVAVFSVAAGDDKADKYRDVVRWADVLVLNKIDLLMSASFDLPRFRSEVRRLNPVIALFEVSARTGAGLEWWAAWLRWEACSRLRRETAQRRHS